MLNKKLAGFNAYKNIHGCLVRYVIKSLFQADSLIVHHIIQKKSLLIVSVDSDLPLLFGVKSIILRGFKLSRIWIKKLKDDHRQVEVSCIEVSGCCNNTTSWVKDVIDTSCDTQKSKRICKEEKSSIFLQK